MKSLAAITVIGIGGAGCSIVDYMLECGVGDLRYFIADTDEQSLRNRTCTSQLSLGTNTKPRPFCHLSPEWCAHAAHDDSALFKQAFRGSDQVIVVAGFGGNAGSGFAPVVCQLARESGVKVGAVIVLPFSFEGRQHRVVAKAAMAALQEHAGEVSVINGDDVIAEPTADMLLSEAIKLVDREMVAQIAKIAGIQIPLAETRPQQSEDAKRVFYAPGRAETWQTSVAGLSLGDGIEVHSIDFTDQFGRMLFTDQMALFIETIEEQFWNEKALLLGRSYGAWILINSLMRMEPVYPGTVVLMSSALGFGGQGGLHFISPRAWRFWEEAEVRKTSPARRMALIHAADDNQWPIKYPRKLKDKWGVELITFEQGGHDIGKSMHQEAISEAIRKFWSQWRT